MTTGSTTRQVGPLQAFAWSLGRLSSYALLLIFSMYALYYLVSVVKLSPALAAALVFASRLADVAISPLVGMASDRLRTRWGRRRPFLLAGGLLGGMACYALLNIPPMGQVGTIAAAAGALLLLTLAYAVTTIPHLAMPMEMTDAPAERLSMMSWVAIMQTVAGLSAGAICPWLLDRYGDGQPGFRAVSLFMGGAVMVAMLACFLGTRRARFTAGAVTRPSMLRALGTVAGNRPFMILVFTHVAGMVLLAGQTSIMLFFVRGILKLPMTAVSVAVACQTAIQFAAVPLWHRVARRWGTKRTFLVASGATGLYYLSWLLASPADGTLGLAVRYTWFGLTVSGVTVCGMAMLSDAIAHDRSREGGDAEGLYTSIYSFTEKTSAGLGVLLTGMLMSAAGFDNRLDPTAAQSPAATAALYVAVAVMPAMGFAIGIVATWRWYHLDPLRAPDDRQIETSTPPLDAGRDPWRNGGRTEAV